MKKKLKFLITVFSVCVVSAMLFTGCNVTESIKQKIEQSRCEHEFDAGEVSKEASCENVGEKTFTCTLCGYEEAEYIPATGHVWQKVNEVSPTCTQVGYTEGIRCVVCNKDFIACAEIPMLEHSPLTINGYSSTCTEEGLSDGSYCSVCNEVLTAQEIIPASGHQLVTMPGYSETCIDSGLTDGQKCDICNEIFVEQVNIPAKGHLDEDKNCICDVCNFELPATTHMTEVTVEQGEVVVGNWYRIYRSATDGTRFYNFFLSDGTQFMAYSILTSSQYKFNYIFKSGPFGTLEGMKVVVTDDYIDVYLEEGTYILLDKGEPTTITCTIDKDTTITGFTSGEVFRLVEADE